MGARRAACGEGREPACGSSVGEGGGRGPARPLSPGPPGPGGAQPWCAGRAHAAGGRRGRRRLPRPGARCQTAQTAYQRELGPTEQPQALGTPLLGWPCPPRRRLRPAACSADAHERPIERQHARAAQQRCGMRDGAAGGTERRSSAPPPLQVSLKLQKRLAASVLGCGLRKVWLDPNEVNDISMANSRECWGAQRAGSEPPWRWAERHRFGPGRQCTTAGGGGRPRLPSGGDRSCGL